MADRGILIKACRFGFSGLLVTGIHAIVASLLITTVMPNPALANGIAFLTSTVFSYTINALWTFSSPLHGRNLVRFLQVSVLGFMIAVTVSGAAEHYGLHYWYGIALVICTVPPITFLLHNFWTFRREPEA